MRERKLGTILRACACAAAGLLLLAAAGCSDDDATPTTTTAGGTAATTTLPSPSTTEPDDLQPLPQGLVPAGCAEETARDLAAFEAALEGMPTLAELCAEVGPPDGTDGTGLIIYVLEDDSTVGLGFAGLGEPVVYAQWLSLDGETHLLLEG